MSYIFGLHAVKTILQQESTRIQTITFAEHRSDEKLRELIELAEQHSIQIIFTAKAKLDEKAEGKNHQGVMAKCQAKEKKPESFLKDLIQAKKDRLLFLILDSVQDPHNLGACLRSADATAVDAIIVPKDNSAPISAVTEKVASGAAQTIPVIQVVNLARTLNYLKTQGVWCYGFSDKASKAFFEADFTGNTALVLGAEGKGVRTNILKHCDDIYAIPMQGCVSSLNVSVAAGVCLYEALRQRLK